MEEHSVIHSTFAIERDYPAAPERVFAAFADPVQKRRWFAEGGAFAAEEFEMDFRDCGSERARYRFPEGSPFPGATYSTETTYHDIAADRRIVLSYSLTFRDRHVSASLVTLEFLALAGATRLVLTHQGAYFEGADGPAMREQGWKALLDRLGIHVAG